MSPFSWVLISFPLYLLVNGRLSVYVSAMGAGDVVVGAVGAVGFSGAGDADQKSTFDMLSKAERAYRQSYNRSAISPDTDIQSLDDLIPLANVR